MVSFGLVGYLVLWALVILQGVLVLALLGRLNEQDSRKAARLEGLLPGTRTPQFVALDAHRGVPVTTNDLNGERYAILFVTPECSTCRYLARNIAHLTESWRLILCCCGHPADCRSRIVPAEHERLTVLIDTDRSVASSLDVSQFPTAVAVDETNTISRYFYPKNASEAIEVLRALALDSVSDTL